MSVTIEIAGYQAVLADGKWRSADAGIAELLNAHLATLALPAHWPPGDRELAAARAAARDFDGKVLVVRHISTGSSGTRNGLLRVFS